VTTDEHLQPFRGDVPPQCRSAQTVPSGARRTIQIVEALRGTCPDAQFILRGLGPKTSDPDSVWPNVYTVVGGLCLASAPTDTKGRLSQYACPSLRILASPAWPSSESSVMELAV